MNEYVGGEVVEVEAPMNVLPWKNSTLLMLAPVTLVVAVAERVIVGDIGNFAPLAGRVALGLVIVTLGGIYPAFRLTGVRRNACTT